MSDILLEPQILDPDTGEPMVAHWVLKKDQMPGYLGQPIKALCGKVWVPSRDYKNLPVCERCKEIAAQRKNRGDN